MPQRHKNLFGQIAHFGALVAASLTRSESERLRLERELQTGRYRPGLPPGASHLVREQCRLRASWGSGLTLARGLRLP
jgi:hypothetical protein